MKRFFILIAVIVLSASAVFAQELQQLPNDPAVRVGQLENGLTYYIRHNALPENRAEFYLATNVGAIQETPDQDGLAHFLEHMCFNGTQNFPGKGILDYLQTIGASFGGNVNAMTGVEMTVYMLTNIPLVNESVVDSCILIMHDYSYFVTNDPAEIDKERGVILAEKSQGSNAQRRVMEKCQQYYYGDSKYNGCTIIGSEENLKNFKPESLVSFYKTWYHPMNQALIVVGDIDVDEIEGKIKSIFADVPRPVDPKAKDFIPIPGNQEPIIGIVTDPELSSSDVEIMWKREALPEMFNSTVEGMYMSICESITSRVMRERFNDITADPNAPYLSASFYVSGLCESTDITGGSISVREGEAIPAFKAYMTEVEKMRRYGFSDAEIERAKENILAGYESAAEKADTRKSSQFVWELINNFFDNEAYMEPATELEIAKMLLPSLNAEIVNMFASQLVTDTNMVVVFTAPEKEGVALPTQQQFLDVIAEVKAMDIQPNEEEVTYSELLDASKLKGSKITSEAEGMYGSTILTLKNGMTVILKPTDFQKDRISIDVYKEGGQSLISTEDIVSFEDNIWSLFLSNTGVSEFPKTTLNKMLAGKNVWAGPYINGLTHGVSASSNVKDLETAFQLLYLNFTDPRFDQKEYDQGIAMIRSVLPNLLEQPNFKLQKRMMETFYNHPRTVMISEEVLNAANLATIEKNYRKLFNNAAGAKAIIVGDFDIETIKPLVEKYLGSIPKGKKAYNWVDDGNNFVEGAVLEDFSEKMETPISTVMDVYSAEIPYSQENVAVLSAIAYILNMRYTTSLREEAGGTYGASVGDSFMNVPREFALLQVYFQCHPDMTDQLRSLVREGIDDLIVNGPTESEMEMTINNLKKNIPESRINNGYWANALKEYYTFNEETDEAFEAGVNAITPEKIQTLLKTIIDSGNHAELVMRPTAE